MEENIKISIVVPVYNIEKYIKRCLLSILAQSYRNLEVLVVDDGSTDKSRKIIDEIKKLDNRIKPIFKENGGVTSARLAGVIQATGQWIGFVDGDDEIESDMYELLLSNALKYGADISHCGYKMIFPDGRINYFHNSRCILQQDNLTGIKDLLDGQLIEPGLCNKLFKRELFNNVFNSQIMDCEIKINEDLFMNYILFSQSNLSVFEDVCKYNYIIRENSATRTNLNQYMIYDPIKVKKIILEMSNQEQLQFTKKAYLSTCINVYNTLMLQKYEEYITEKKQIRSYIVEKKEWIKLLSKKQQLLANLICTIPMCYPLIYRIYAKKFLKDKYN